MSGARKLQSKFVGFLFYLCVGVGGTKDCFLGYKINIVIFGWWWFGSVGLDCIFIFPFVYICMI